MPKEQSRIKKWAKLCTSFFSVEFYMAQPNCESTGN